MIVLLALPKGSMPRGSLSNGLLVTLAKLLFPIKMKEFCLFLILKNLFVIY